MAQGLPIGEPVNLQQIGGVDIVLGQQLEAASIPIVLTSAQISTLTPPPAITGFATETTLGLINGKLVSGTDIGDVTINNGAGVGAVNIQDGGNTITVDGTVTVNVITGFATSANQTNNLQTTQIVNAAGNAVTVTGNKLDVNATISATIAGAENKWQIACDAGQGYTTTSSVITVAGSAEVAYILIRNPLGSGKTVRIHLIDASLDEATGTPRAIIKLYRDPTITTNGTALTIYNLLKSGGASVINVYRQPTIAANGSLMYTAMYARDANPIDFDLGLSIQPNENFLITVEPNATNLGHIHSITWMEE